MTDPATDTIMATTTDSVAPPSPGKNMPINLATISSGFEKGDFRVREE